MKILSGTEAADAIAKDLSVKISAMPRPPALCVVSIGGRADSEAYIAAKQKFAARIGAIVRRVTMPEDVTQEDAVAAIEKEGGDPGVDGIILQLPVPESFDPAALILAIPREKDADGLTRENLGRFMAGDLSVIPATARGVLNLMDFYGVEAKGARAVVVGRSLLVGRSVALALLFRDATVTICHRGTPDLSKITASADILVSAAGVPGLIRAEHIRPGAVVIDIGIRDVGDHATGGAGKRTLKGDVDAAAASSIAGAISPVPGGVGPMTVSALFQNLVEAAARNLRRAG